MKSYAHVIQFVSETPWAILPSKLAEITGALERIVAGAEISEAEIEAIVAARPQRPAPQSGAAVAVLPLFGTISHRAGMMAESSGGTSTERFGAVFQQAVADPGISAIVLDVDSPGGTVTGVDELAQQIYQARGKKPVVAVANGLAASAAYWLASAADELVVTPSGDVGSIGVIAAHQDVSKAMEAKGVTTTLISAGKYKAEGSPYAPLDPEARAAFQARVDEHYGTFTRTVARNRAVPVAQVRNGFGEGRVVGARQAVQLGMADRVGTLEATIQRLASGQWQRPERAMGALVEFSNDDDALEAEAVAAATETAIRPSLALRRRRLRILGG